MGSAILVSDAASEQPWLVMVHGMSQDHRVFSAQVEAFRPRYRILLIDLPGHGLSAAVGGPFGHVEFADHVAQALAANAAERVHYWGTHTGATIGLYLAATRTGLIDTLILEAPLIPGGNPPVVVHQVERAKAIARERGVRAALDDWWNVSCWFESMRAHPEACRAAAHRAIIDDFGGQPWLDDRPTQRLVDVETLLKRIAIPALIYNGTEDHSDFIAAADDIGRLLQHARQIVIPECGGFPAWENPETVCSLVDEFLGQTEAGRRT